MEPNKRINSQHTYRGETTAAAKASTLPQPVTPASGKKEIATTAEAQLGSHASNGSSTNQTMEKGSKPDLKNAGHIVTAQARLMMSSGEASHASPPQPPQPSQPPSKTPTKPETTTPESKSSPPQEPTQPPPTPQTVGGKGGKKGKKTDKKRPQHIQPFKSDSPIVGGGGGPTSSYAATEGSAGGGTGAVPTTHQKEARQRTRSATNVVIDAERLEKLKAKFGTAGVNREGSVRIGGKGSVRRKQMTRHKATAAADSKQMKSALSKIGARSIPAIESVNMFREDGKVLHFKEPKLEANIAANVYGITGTPRIITVGTDQDSVNQFSADDVRAIYTVQQARAVGAEGMGHTRGGGGGGGGGGTDGVEEDDTLDDDLRRPPGGATLAELNDDEVPSLTSATTGAEAIPAHASPGTTIRTAEAAISGVGAAAKKKDETAAAVVEMPALVTLGANDDADY